MNINQSADKSNNNSSNMQKFKNSNQLRGPGNINRSGSGGGSPIGQIRGTNGGSSPMSNPTVPNTSNNG